MTIEAHKVVALASADLDGLNIVPSAQYSLLLDGIAAIIFEDKAGTIPLSNPATCDRNGELIIYTENGDYTESMNGGKYWPVRIG